MRILYLSHRIPYPPHTGDKVRSFHQIRHLAQRHRIALACFAESRVDLEHVSTLRQWCDSVDIVVRSRRRAKIAGLRGLLSGRSLAVTAFDSASLRQKVRARPAGESFDAVLAFTAVMAPYGVDVAARARVIDFVDVDSEKWRNYGEHLPWPGSWLYGREADRLQRFEIETVRRWDTAIFVSEREAAYLRPHVRDRPLTILTNGVDLEYFVPHPVPPVSDAADVVFTGVMDYVPNADAVIYFCQTILPRIRDIVPSVRFAIVGRDPTPAVRRLSDPPHVTVTGTVPDIRHYLAGARVAVAPLRIARGVQNKILEAMASGVPVVSTPEAFAGLDADRAEGIDVAPDASSFANAVVRLLRDEPYRREQAARARAYVEREHRWEHHGQALEALLEDLVGEAR